jgi:hypothetical protein
MLRNNVSARHRRSFSVLLLPVTCLVTTPRAGSIRVLKRFHRRKKLEPQRTVIGRGVALPKYHWIIRTPLCYWIIRAEIAQILRHTEWTEGTVLPTQTTTQKNRSSVTCRWDWPELGDRKAQGSADVTALDTNLNTRFTVGRLRVRIVNNLPSSKSLGFKSGCRLSCPRLFVVFRSPSSTQ